MKLLLNVSQYLLVTLVFVLLVSSNNVMAGGGYFSLGYGHVAKQTSGAVTAVAEDAFAGASNPGKLTAAGNQFDVGVELFNSHRKARRTGSGTPFDFSSNSRNSFFLIPEFAYSHQLNNKVAVGITAYANGGLNSEYAKTTGIPGTNANPASCGTKPGDFLLAVTKRDLIWHN